MKKSKLLKFITFPSLATVIGVAPLTLCQCGNSSDPSTPTIDPTVSSKVNITTTTDTDGNTVSTLKTKTTTDKITDVTVSIGSTTLVKDSEYKVTGLSSNSGSVVVTIFKDTLNKYTGSIVIKPTITSEPAVWKSISCDPTSISIEVNGTVKASNITVKAVYSDGTTTPLTWNTGYKVYKGSEEQTNFGTGIQFTTKGIYPFTIKAVADETKTATLTISVTEEMATITFKGINGTVSTSSKKVEKGTLWGDVSKPTATPSYGYENIVIWRKGSSTGAEMQASDPIDSNMTICACFETEYTTTSGGTKTHDTANEKLSSHISYVPNENYDASSSYLVKRIEYTNHAQYTFKITLDENITNIKYFWIVQIKTSANELYMMYDTPKNIVSVKHNSEEVGYKLYSNNGGKYISLDSTCTSGTIEITMAFHEENNLPLKFIPAFEKA